VDSSLLNERREARARLRRIVEPEMDALADLVSDSDSVVLPADADGLVLDSSGGLGFLRKAEQVSLQPGVYWSEQRRGTNAIGTALAESKPVAVRGRQHYLDANGILSCAAAPILTPRGDLSAVLDISGDSEQLHSQALSMVRRIRHPVALPSSARPDRQLP
jgi:transcriptional regulator of acetoin/glycerol metabolism